MATPAARNSRRPTAEENEAVLAQRRARRRLVGAVLLTLLVAFTLPLVLDDKPRPLNPNISVAIPALNGKEFEPQATPVLNSQSAAKAAAQTPPPAAADKAVAAAAAPTASGQKFFLNIGVFKLAEFAQKRVAELQGSGMLPFVEKSGELNIVRLGPFKNREEAERVRAELTLRGFKPVLAE